MSNSSEKNNEKLSIEKTDKDKENQSNADILIQEAKAHLN